MNFVHLLLLVGITSLVKGQEQDGVVMNRTSSTSSTGSTNSSTSSSSSSSSTGSTNRTAPFIPNIASFDPLADEPLPPPPPKSTPTTRQTEVTEEQVIRDQPADSAALGIETTLIHVHALWRHGNRAPEWFPANLAQSEKDSWPGGLNALTKKGLQQAYRLGELLRERYATLLSGPYSPNKIYIRSSDTDRTLASAEALMNGLVSDEDYGVTTDERLKVFPVHTIKKDTDKLFNYNINCPARDQEEYRVFNAPEFGFPALGQKTASFMRWIQNQTGEADMDYQAGYKVWDYLYYLEADERPLPSWARPEAREQLEMINGRLNQGLMGTKKLLRLRSGPVLKEMTERIRNIARGSYSSKEKFYGYSAHDHTLAFLLKILGLNFWRFPEPTSALIFELHRRTDDEHFVKMYFRNFTSESFQEIKLPQCHGDCHLQTFLAYLQSFIPEDWERECGLDEERHQSNGNYSILLYVAIAQSIVLFGLILFLAVCLVRTFRFKRIVNPLEKIDY